MNRQGSIDRALAEWRKKHQIAENDPLAALAELLFHFRVEEAGREPTAPAASVGVQRWVATVAVCLGVLGGFLLGRAFHG